MQIRRHLAVVATATLAFGAASLTPTLTGADTASAHPAWHSWSPWPAVYVIASAGSVIVNAAYVWNTQCRELSSREAITSAALPLVGIVFDAQASKCRR